MSKKYYGTVTVTYEGWFEADGIEEIKDNPERCIYNCTIETEVVDMEEGEPDGDWEE